MGDTIESILEEEPNDESLLKLLKTTSPAISLDQITDGSPSTTPLLTGGTTNTVQSSERRSKALRTLKSRIHPDKHPQDKRATHLFQNVQLFYDDCCATLISNNT